MPVDRLQRGLKCPIIIGFQQAAHHQLRRVTWRHTCREQDRNAPVLGDLGEVDPASLPRQPDVAQNQVDLLAIERRDRVGEPIEGCDNLIAGVGDHIFILECGQGLVLNDKDPLDDTLTFPEQHEFPVGQTGMTSQRTKRAPVPRAPRRGGGPAQKSRGPKPGPAREEGPQRIAKLLARAGVASRRDIERMIAEGRIAVDGEKLTTPATLLESLKGVTVDGEPVKPPAAARLYLFYKPSGTLTAARDPKGRPTIYDKLPPNLPRLIPVGRLDYMTEGLLLLTNDGELKRQLELPRTGVVRRYRARAFGDVTQAQLEELAEGVTIEGIRYGSIDANLERRTGRNCWIELSLTEGKNREVRNVLAYLGLQVSRLIRTSYGPFTIEGMEAGDVGEVQREILFQFRRTLK